MRCAVNVKTPLCSFQIYIHCNVWVTEASSSCLVGFQACKLSRKLPCEYEMRFRFLLYGRVHVRYITVPWLLLNHIDVYHPDRTDQWFSGNHARGFEQTTNIQYPCTKFCVTCPSLTVIHAFTDAWVLKNRGVFLQL